MAIYDIASDMCEQRRDTVDEGVDLAVLLSVLGGLSRLTEVRLDFRLTAGENDWLNEFSLFFQQMTMSEKKSCEHHIRVVSNSIRSARHSGVSIYTINLLGFNLVDHNPLQDPDLSTLSASLRELLDFAQILRLTESKSALEVLPHCALKLRQTDMCDLTIEHKDLKNFLDTNKKSIRSIGFHNVRTTGRSRLDSRTLVLSSSTLCGMLNVPWSTPCRADDCGCSPWGAVGWRLLLNVEYLRCSPGTSAKRKFNEIERRFRSRWEDAL
jgi:hypothetical protein